MGHRYVNNTKELRAFARMNAGISLATVRKRHVLTFLNSRPTGRWTWAGKHARLRAFFVYWISRREIARSPMPRARRVGQRTFSPYVFSCAEIQALLRKAPEIQSRKFSAIRVEAFRMLVILLYATGIWVDEALSLRWRDVDLTNSFVTLRSRLGASRQIPIGSDLTGLLKQYLAWSAEKDLLFLTTQGRRISSHRAARHFRRTRCLAGISRADGATRQPGLRDFRHTFAVHRICEWYRQKTNLELMLPRLAAYMGFRSFDSTSRYLPLAPKHFQRQVRALSKGLEATPLGALGTL